MNNSIRNLIDKPIQPFGSFEAINAEKSLKRKYEKIDSGSELAETANLSNQIAQPKLKEIQSTSDEDNQKPIVGSSWPPAIEDQEEDEEDLFSDQPTKSLNQLVGANEIEIEEMSEKKAEEAEKSNEVAKKSNEVTEKNSEVAEKNSEVAEKNSEVAEKSDKIVEKTSKVVTTNAGRKKTDALRQRIITADNVEIIRGTFVGDVAIEFESRKQSHLRFMTISSNKYDSLSHSTFRTHGISLSEGLALIAALRAVALELNKKSFEGKDRIELTEEEMKKVNNKATNSLRPDMKDPSGNPITDDLFDLIKDEINESVIASLILAGLINRQPKTEKEERSVDSQTVLDRTVKFKPLEDRIGTPLTSDGKENIATLIKQKEAEELKSVYEQTAKKFAENRKEVEELKKTDENKARIDRDERKKEDLKRSVKNSDVNKDQISHAKKERVKLTSNPEDQPVDIIDYTKSKPPK